MEGSAAKAIRIAGTFLPMAALLDDTVVHVDDLSDRLDAAKQMEGCKGYLFVSTMTVSEPYACA